MKSKETQIAGIVVKKQFGQHFLRDQSVIDHMLQAVQLSATSSIMEIGCGDGFLTKSILHQTKCARLWVFEIDAEWVTYVKNMLPDARLTIFEENILDVNLAERLTAHAPWTLLANLPYQITFPILHLLQKNRTLFTEGVIMVQEEVAQKIVKKSGKGYGFPSLFFQRYFSWQLLDKIKPGAFLPPPKVDSRLLYFKPKTTIPTIDQEDEFWKFIKLCFHQPRRTLKNNLQQSHYDMNLISAETLALRAQQMSMNDFVYIWHQLIKSGGH